MSDNSKIEWTDATWNPIRGCSRVSEGCRNCYAERVAARFSGPGMPYEGLIKFGKPSSVRDPRWSGEVRMVPEHLAAPLRWRRPRRVFVNSMSDLFHESLTNEQIAAVFGVMAATPRHTYQVLTKRTKRMRAWFEWARRDFTEQQRGIASAPNTFRAMLDAAFEVLGQPSKPVLDAAWRAHDDDVWPLPNVWLGVSVENQAAADERIPELLATPAAVRWISAEPLLGPVDFAAASPNARSLVEDLDWIVAGCESGPGARPCDVAWLRSLRDQCKTAGVAFFLKQAVEPPFPHDQPAAMLAGIRHFPPTDTMPDGSHRKAGGVIGLPYLDGVQHAALPESA